MIVGTEPRGFLHWMSAFGLSLLLHGLLLAWLFFPLMQMLSLRRAPDVPLSVTLTAVSVEPEMLELAPEVPQPDAAPEESAPAVETGPEEPAQLPEDLPAPEYLSPADPAEGKLVLRDDGTLFADANSPGLQATVIQPISPSALPGIAPLSEPATAENPPETGPQNTEPPESAQIPEESPDQGNAEYNEFAARIREQLSVPCLIATPRLLATGPTELEFLAADETDIRNFSAELLKDVSPQPQQRNVLIDARQCPALNFVRQNPSYPAYGLKILLERDRFPSGERLIGRVENAAGRYVSLMLVDDNGVVQDLGGYLTFVGAEVRFDVPMTRAGAARDTSQLLLALATQGKPAALLTHDGHLAQEFFDVLQAGASQGTALMMKPFAVE